MTFSNFNDYYYYDDANERWARDLGLIKEYQSYYGMIAEINKTIESLNAGVFLDKMQDNGFLR